MLQRLLVIKDIPDAGNGDEPFSNPASHFRPPFAAARSGGRMKMRRSGTCISAGSNIFFTRATMAA
jgi:hypothetical protein